MRVEADLKLTFKLMSLMLYLIIYVHFVGCIFYILIKADQEWTSTTDGTRLPASIYNKEFWYKYWMIFYTSVFMLIGAEVNPVTTFDHFYCGTMIISGALISAVMFGEMALVMDNLNRKTNEFNTKLDSTSTAMKNINLPTPLEVKIMEYVI